MLACSTLQLIMPENEASAVSTVTMPADILIMLPCTSTWPGAVILTPLESIVTVAPAARQTSWPAPVSSSSALTPPGVRRLILGWPLAGSSMAMRVPALPTRVQRSTASPAPPRVSGGSGATVPERADHHRVARIALEESDQHLAADVGQHEGAVVAAGERHRDARPERAGLAAMTGAAEQLDLDPIQALGVVDRHHLGEADRLLQQVAEAVRHPQPPNRPHSAVKSV